VANTFFARWKHVFEYHPPEGGPIAFPRLKTGENIAAWCDQVVSESGVLLLPASVYEHARSADRGHFRLGLGRKDFALCLEQLEAWLLKHYEYEQS
jgi:aspartate/methionine/tyrosine aminotransferase